MGKRGKAAAAAARVTQAQLAGSYVYRFNGQAMSQGQLYALEGIGQLQLDAQGNLSGAHQYALLGLQGSDGMLYTGSYTLEGELAIAPDGTGTATIHFTSQQGQGEDEDGQFQVLVADTVNRIWLISSGATTASGPKQEIARLEALRIVDQS